MRSRRRRWAWAWLSCVRWCGGEGGETNNNNNNERKKGSGGGKFKTQGNEWNVKDERDFIIT